MTGKIWDSPTRVWVDSESEHEKGYLIELTDFPVGELFNGSCQCKHFVCNLAPRLRTPGNRAIYRCKHLHWARNNVLDMILHHLKRMDKNVSDDVSI